MVAVKYLKRFRDLYVSNHLKRFRDLYASNHLKRFDDLSNSVDDIRFRLHVLPHPKIITNFFLLVWTSALIWDAKSLSLFNALY